MNKLAIIRSFVITLAIMLVSVFAYAQNSSLEGSGTQNDPYLIDSNEDWETFVNDVNVVGYDYSGKYVKLNSDVPNPDEVAAGTTAVTLMVGVWDAEEANRKPFSGIFLGNNNTITVRYSNSVAGKYTAPFVCTKGATIKQINVAGNIVSTVGYAAGLIGGNYGLKTKVETATNFISVDITDGSNGSAGDYCAGVAVDGTLLEISSCVYNGKIKAGDNSAGFVAIGNSSNTKINNCLFVPAEGSAISGGDNFSNGLTYNSNNYYTYKVSASTQGTQAYATYEGTPDEGCFELKELYDGNSYYIPGTAGITGLLSSYYQSYARSGGITYNITFNGEVIDNDKFTEGIYNGDVLVEDITTITPGSYTLKIRGVEGYYKGLLTASITIVDDVLEGSGTEDDPYRIGTASDWTAFATAVSGGHTFVGEFLKLTADVLITDGTMAGASSKNFSGTFDGNYHKLTFNCGTDAIPFNQAVCAPFRYIKNATIKNLTVDGTIISSNERVGGFAGFTTGTNSFYNCTSSINIKCNYISTSGYYCNYGGFVGNESDGVIDLNKCLFEGRIFDSKEEKTATQCAGFIGWANGTVNCTECFMVGVIDVAGLVGNCFRANGEFTSDEGFRRLVDYQDGEKPGPNGFSIAQIESNPPLSKKYYHNDVTYYLPVSLVLGLESTNYDGNAKTPHVNYYGKTVDPANYTIDIKKKDGSGNYTIIPDPYEINTAGDYQVTITGTGDYAKDEIVSFKIIGAGERWSDLRTLLNGNSSVTLEHDYVALESDNPIIINNNVTIDLNGHKIDRNLQEAKVNGYVLRIEKNKTVTIEDNSTEHTGYITGGFNIHDGGGIFNNGKLTLNDVTIKNNEVVKKTGESASGRGAGIYSSDGSTLTINRGQIINNNAVGGGGGIYSNKAILTMNGVLLQNNFSEDKGGAMRIGVGGTGANITGCTFKSNRTGRNTESKGGAIHLEGPSESSRLNLTNCVFDDNFAYKIGGAIYSIKGIITVINCTFTGNEVYDYVGIGDGLSNGGAIGLYTGSTLILEGRDDGCCSITGGTAMSNGGAIYVFKGAKVKVTGKVIVESCHVEDFYEGTYYNSNVYFTNSSDVIEVIGVLDPESRIGVSQKGGTGNVVKDPNGYSTLDNFVLDNEPERRLRKDDSGNVIVYNIYPWNASYTWNSAASSLGHEPTADDDVTINLAVEIPEGCVANAGNITITDPNKGEIIIKDGGQLINNNSINATVEKNIEKTTTDENGWYAISSAVHDSDHDYESISNIENISVNAYKDMFRYNEALSLWENQEAESGAAGFTTLDMGRGYLYRNTDDVTLSYRGVTNVADVTYNLSCAATNNLKGFNLVGNPFTHNITLLNTYLVDNAGNQIKDGDNDVNLTGFYRITSEGAWSTEITSTSEPIAVNEGFLIQIPEAAKKIKFSKTARGASKANPKSIMFTIENSEYSDVTYAIFEQGLGLNKINHHNEAIPMLYINHKDKDYAIATMDEETKSFGLGFKSTTTGWYTLSLETEGNFGYIHLIDKYAEKEIDMIKEGEYSFIGSASDNEDRFIVRLAYIAEGGDDEEEFAYQNGDDIVVSGEGELQIFDLTGRLVARQYVNGIGTISFNSHGVYIMRLNDKTQKIVVK